MSMDALQERAERDELWRQHEESQIKFIQEQNFIMFNHLHMEIEKLNSIVRIYQYKVAEEKAKNEELERRMILLENKLLKQEKTIQSLLQPDVFYLKI